MGRQLVGTLKNPIGLGVNGKLRIVALEDKRLGLVQGTVYETDLINGAYDVTLEDGEYRIDMKTGKRFYTAGTIIIEDGAPATIPELISE